MSTTATSAVAAIVDPNTLLGKEMRDTLGQRAGLFRDVRLLAAREDEVGNLTEIGGAAALVARCDRENLEGVDVAFLCGAAADAREAMALLPAAATPVLLSLDATAADGRPVVAGVNLGGAGRGRPLLSPHPAAILLAHLLHPLRGLGVAAAVATVIQPVSMHGDPGLDALFEQTRDVLSMSGRQSSALFGGQLAFNLLPTPAPAGPVAAELAEVLGAGPPVSLQIVQGGVFHSLAASVHVRLAAPVEVKALRKALAEHPFLELVKKPGHLGPIDAAAHDKVLVGAVHEDAAAPGGPGGYWLWAVMDNLTRGGALNALAVAEEILEST